MRELIRMYVNGHVITLDGGNVQFNDESMDAGGSKARRKRQWIIFKGEMINLNETDARAAHDQRAE